jgi:O-antigen/teichoic acid export membrane protein
MIERCREYIEKINEGLSYSPIAYRLASGAFWSLIGGVTSRALTMIASIIVARLLGREGFGELGMIQSTIGMFGVFAGFGLGSTATKYIAEYKLNNPIRAVRITDLTIIVSCITAGVVSLACLLMAPSLAETTLNQPDLAPLVEAAALMLFISAMGGVLQAALAGFESFRVIARINIIQGVAAPFITVPLVWLYGLDGAVAALTVNAALGLILCAGALKIELAGLGIERSPLTDLHKEHKVLWRFSLPSTLSLLIVMTALWIINLILVNQPDGYSELGFYSAASQWGSIITFIPGFLSAAMLPVISERHGRNANDDFSKAIIINLRMTLMVALPLTVLVISFAEPVAALYGREFDGVAPILPIIMVAGFLNAVNMPVGITLAGAGRMWTGALFNLAWAIILIVVSFILIPVLGALGMAIAYLTAYLLHTVWQIVYVETCIVRLSIVSQWRLMIFTVCVLAVSSGFAYLYAGLFIYKLVLLFASFLPLFMLMLRWIKKIDGKMIEDQMK